MEIIIALSHAALLTDANIPFSLDKLASSVPSATSLRHYINSLAADNLFDACEEILSLGARVYLMCDKGALKTANAHFVKILCWYSKDKHCVRSFNIDTEESDASSHDCGNAINHALKKVLGDKRNGILYGQNTDSGGGGTGKSLQRELTSHGVTAQPEIYLTAYCTLHCVQLTISNAVENVIGTGGMQRCNGQDAYKQNAMQLLHGVYNLQDHHEKAEWKQIFVEASKSITGDDVNEPPTVPKPILTRWWTVGVAAAFLLSHWDVIGAVTHGVIQHTNTTHACNKIASGVQSLMAEKQAKSDILLIAAYHHYFLFTHFNWLQKGDIATGDKPGFNNRNVLVRYYLMYKDLERVAVGEGWR